MTTKKMMTIRTNLCLCEVAIDINPRRYKSKVKKGVKTESVKTRAGFIRYDPKNRFLYWPDMAQLADSNSDIVPSINYLTLCNLIYLFDDPNRPHLSCNSFLSMNAGLYSPFCCSKSGFGWVFSMLPSDVYLPKTKKGRISQPMRHCAFPDYFTLHHIMSSKVCQV
jgi:hypothetical protein